AWLDANENSRINLYNRYPDPLQMAVKEKLAMLRGVDPASIFLGVGSDECIDIAYRVFCRPGVDNVLAIEPTYGMYKVCADINDVEYRCVELDTDFRIDTERLLAAADANTKLLWLCSPNNPTGNAYEPEQLIAIAERFNGITIVDEAYVDFSTKGSVVSAIATHPRLIVMQTLSKAWASAAIRLGIAYASPEIIEIYNKVKYPYNVNELTQRQAIRILEDADHVTHVVHELVDARMQLTAELAMLPDVLHIYPSDANFLLMKVTDANGIYAFLRDNGVIVRNRSRVTGCEDCIRVTVGTDEENRLLIQKLTEYGNMRR
ncbi:MAG: histidinol-phosphate transaminase, partial [Muribaculaceae bacterium]|nr:histidinol-phosphate transaminase [Muribaculaceae bacterium]